MLPLIFFTSQLLVEMNHFQRLNEVKELKIFFFAQRANTRKQATSRRSLPCDAWAPTAQNRASAVRERHVSTQKTGSYITERSRLPGLIVGPCPSEESLCCPACPPPPPPSFSQILGPRSLKCVSYFLVFALQLYVSYVGSHHFPWQQPHELQSIRFSRLTAIRAHHPISHVSLGEAPSRLTLTVFPPEGLLLSGQGGCSRRPYQG